MAPRRLSDTDKQELVGRYKSGESTAALAEAFGCSPNTVTRTVKALLPPEAYSALKASRLRTPAAVSAQDPAEEEPVDSQATDVEEMQALTDAAESALALDDADDFGDSSADEDDGASDDEADAAQPDPFLELVPLAHAGLSDASDHVDPTPLNADVLPATAYMLVDKVVELDPRPLKEFPDLGTISADEQERQGLYLFASPRSAKRQCSRNQRVIKVPDTGVFMRTSQFLLARGITRLVLDGTLIALDSEA